ncbi:hypothetical protein H0N99_00895 [Candidatus Micrarchaeota archaeon]|nr:hypothetical protein [Candidatus Micrarchaeota archaeon]
MDWKKVLKASFIPVAVLFLILMIGELLFRSLAGYTQYGLFSYFGMWYLGSTFLTFISIGYAAIRKYNLEVGGLIYITGILAILFFFIAQAAMTLFFPSTILYHTQGGTLPFVFFEVFGLTVGWTFALTVQKIKPKTKKPKQS